MKRKIIKFVVVFTFILCCWGYFWNIGFHDFIPWTRTHFASYDKYIEFIYERSFYASRCFMDELPEDSSSIKYYCHQAFKDKIVAHSIVLEESEYLNIKENQTKNYWKSCDSEAQKLVYLIDEDKCWFVRDLKHCSKNNYNSGNLLYRSCCK